MDYKIKLLFFSVVISCMNSEYLSYKNYKVYKTVPSSDKEVQILIDLQKEGHMFWSDVIAVNSDIRIMVEPSKQDDVGKYLTSVGINATVAIDDVQRLIDAQLSRPISRNVQEYDWTYYQSLDEINDWLDHIAETYSDVVTLVNIGQSNEGRAMRGVKIDFQKKENPVIGMLEGGIHAREWISPATLTYVINEFLTSTDPDVRALAENIVWHIFPVVNPDGYLYTFTNNRMWRKNRNPANFVSCAQWGLSDDISNGIDLNRNFGFVWMTTGASSNPCAETFAGPVAFSEPESVALANYVSRIKQEGHMVYYIAFHSYSQMVLVPYSHVGGANVLEAPNYGDMYEIAIRGMDKLKATHGTDYIVGTSADILYEVSGSSFDYMRGVEDIPIVYLIELRDTGTHGFLLPPELIIDNNEEIMAALIEMDRVTKELNYYSSGNMITFGTFIMILSLVISL